VAVTGSGVNTTSTLTTTSATAITSQSATLGGTVTNSGCSPVTSYGVEFSPVAGFIPGTGAAVNAANLSGGSFNVNVDGLIQGLTYYYRSFAVNNGGNLRGREIICSGIHCRRVYRLPGFR
jgi:hypothetical protein